VKLFGKRKAKRRKKKKPSDGTMDFILVLLAVFLLAFIVTMIVLFLRIGAIPDTLVTCVFAICGGEAGILGWIKTNKERVRDRQWQKEDQKEEQKREKRIAQTSKPNGGIAMEKKNSIGIEPKDGEEITEETVGELSNGKGDDEDE